MSAAAGISLAPLVTEIKVKFDDFKNQMSQMVSTAETAAKNTSAKLEGISKVGEKLGSIGKTMSTTITAPITAVGAAAVKVASDFESGMSQVAATMGFTTDQLHDSSSSQAQDFEKLKDAAKEMGATTQFSASQASEALNYLALAGYDVDTSISTLPDVLNLAAAGGLELGTACDMVTDAASALCLTTEQTTVLVDQMAKTSQKSNTSVGQLGEAILTVGGTANSLKGGLTEMNTALGEMANVGLKGAEGGTHLRNIILSLSAPTDVAAGALKTLGVETEDANGNLLGLDEIMGQLNTKLSTYGTAEKASWISKIFNKTDLTAVQGLMASTVHSVEDLGNIMNNVGYNVEDHGRKLSDLSAAYDKTKDDTENLALLMRQFEMSEDQAKIALEALKSAANDTTAWDNLASQIDDSTGSAGEQAKTMMDNLKGSITLLKSALEGLGIQIGDIILPYVRSFTDHINNLVTWLSQLSPSVQRTVVAIAAFAAALGPALLIVGKVITTGTTIVSAISGISAAFSGLIASTGTVGAALGALVTGPVALVIAGVAALALAIATDFGGIRGCITTIMTEVSTIITTTWTIIQSIWNNNLLGIQTITTTIFNAIQAIFSTVFGVIQGLFQAFSAAFQGDWSGCWNAVQGIASTIWEDIKSLIGLALNAVVDLIIGLAANIYAAAVNTFNSAKTGATEAWEALKAWFSGAVNDPVGTLQGIGSALYSAGSSVISQILSGFKSAWSGVTSWFSEKVDWIKQKVQSFKDMASSMTGGGSDGSHYNGLSYVPFDGYNATLHKGERVLTAEENKAYTREQTIGSSGGGGLSLSIANFYNNRQSDVRQLAEEFEFYRRSAK